MHLYGRLEKKQGIIKGSCTVDDCNNPIKGNGLCAKHYQLKRKYGRTEKLVRNKTKHSFYHLWHERKQNKDLATEWLDFWQFVNDVGLKPEGNYFLMKLDVSLPYGPDNFKWQEKLSILPDETDKEFWARKWADARIRNPDIEYERNLQRSFGMNLDEYLQKFKNQNGVCAICEKEETTTNGKSGIVRRLAVDHCHNSNKIRDLLCNRCNITLGKIEDSVELLQKMINYLNKHKETD